MRWVRWFVVPVIVLAVVVPWRVPVASAASGDYTVMGGTPTYVRVSDIPNGQAVIEFWFASGAPGTGGRYGSADVSGVQTSWGGVPSQGSHMWTVGDAVGGVFPGWYQYFTNVPGSGTRVTVSMPQIVAGDEGYWHSCTFPANSLTFTMPAHNGTWYTWASVGGAIPLSVELSGVSSVTVGTSYDYSAVVSGGVGPYRVVFQRVCTSHSADDRTYAAQSGSGPVFTESVVFPSAMWSYDVVVTVTDSLGASASDSVTVNARAERPTVYGYLYESATSQGGGLLLFYASLTPPGETWPGESGMLPVEGPGAGRYWYTLDVPGWATHWANGYTLSLAEPFPATVTAMITVHDQTTGDSWTLVFSFDTSGLTGPGSWTSSEGGGESFGEDENWIGRLLNSLKAMLKEVFQWLFVPTDAQMRSLVPSGTIANGLLEGVPSLGSGEKGVFTVSMKLPLSDGVEVPIMVIDTGEFASTTFAVVVRTVVQAGMSLGLILMVVSWI